MKPAGLLLTVILLLAGVSCVTKDRSETCISNANIVAEISLTKEVALQLPGLVNKNVTLPKKPRVKPVHTYIKNSECGGAVDNGDVIPPPVEDTANSEINDDSIALFMCILEIEADYPGGAKAWSHFLKKNLKFPKSIRGKKISEAVMVDFVIDEEGNVTEVKAICGLEPLTTEAVRVIKKSGKWKPATRAGRHVRSFKRQPVIFREE